MAVVFTSTSGEKHPRSTVTDKQAVYIRGCMLRAAKAGRKQKKDMKKFLSIVLGTSESVVHSIHSGRRYGGVK